MIGFPCSTIDDMYIYIYMYLYTYIYMIIYGYTLLIALDDLMIFQPTQRHARDISGVARNAMSRGAK